MDDEITVDRITPKGVALADQLWAAATHGATLQELGQQLVDYGFEAEDSLDSMEAVVLLLAASLGVDLVERD